MPDFSRVALPACFRKSLLAVLVGGLAQGAVAEDAELPPMTVTSTALQEPTPVASDAVHPETVKALRPATSDTARLLKDVPGVSLYNAGGVSSLPVIRGLADDRLRIKVDGMDLISACGNHMNPPLSYIDPSNVGSARVYAGITPVSLGGDSIGGTILVDTAEPRFAAPGEGLLTEGEVGAFFRGNGNGIGGNLAATAASDTFSLSYRGAASQADNYSAGADFKPAGPAAAGRGHLDGDEVGSSAYQSINHSVGLAVHSGQHLAELKVGVQNIPYQGWPNQRMDMTGNSSTQVNLNYEGDYDWGLLQARAYHEHTRHQMQFSDDKLFWYGSSTGMPTADGQPCVPSGGMMGCAAGMPMDTEGENSGLVLKGELPLPSGDLLRVGAEAQRYRLDDWWDASGKGMWPDTFWNIRDGERDRLALFGEWEAQWTGQWSTLLGARFEQVRMDTGQVQGYNATYAAEAAAFNAADRGRSDDNLDLVAVARFMPDPGRTFEIGYARKTRSPNLYERYAWSTGGMAMRMINLAGDGNGYVGNLDLEPEVAHTVSATFDWHAPDADRWAIKVTPYYTYVDDYIDAARCSSANLNCGPANQTASDAFVYLQYVNQSARLYGVDLSGHFPLADATAIGDLRARGVLSWVRGENRSTGDNLYNVMPLNATLALEQHSGAWANTLEVELVDAKTEVSAVRNEIETEAYGLLHLRSSYQWRQVRLDMGIENLLDKFYNHPLGGAYMGQGKTMSGTDVPWGVTVPGMGRNFYAGVSVSF